MMPVKQRSLACRWVLGNMVLLTAAGLAVADPVVARDSPTIGQPVQEGLVRVGMLVYGGGKSGVCFSSGFLADVSRQTGVRVSRRFELVDLADVSVFGYPFVIISGTGPFELSGLERDNLRAYLERGGFLLASAGCSNRSWSESFQKAVAPLLPPAGFEGVPLDHPIFRTLYNIDRLPTRKGSTTASVFGAELGGRLAVVFSPVGLNDTARAGQGCCCCGGNELRNASQINANLLVYALTH